MDSGIIYSAILGVFGIIAIIIGIKLIISKRKFVRNSIKKKALLLE